MIPSSLRWLSLAGLTLAACGGVASPSSTGALVADGAAGVQWVGIDTRHLAVGSQLAVGFEFAGAPAPVGISQTASNSLSSAIGYTVTSSDPSVISVQDLGGQRLILSVLGAGNATLELTSELGDVEQPLVAAVPTSVSFSDWGHLVAGEDTQLSTTFGLLQGSEEAIGAIVMDASGNPLNSWGLTQGRVGTSPTGAPSDITVTKVEPEQFILETLQGAPDTAGESSLGDVPNTFIAGLVGVPSSDVTFTVGVLSAPSSATLDWNGTLSTAVARALAADGQTEVFGVTDWNFTCTPKDSCIVDPLSLSAWRVELPSSTAAQSYAIGVSSPSYDLSATRQIP